MRREPEKALDVACGTGHATVELDKICASAVGCDISSAMLQEAARQNPALNFVQAAAETLPFASCTFDLINISMAIHWINQEAFLREARRLLRPGGILSIDNYGFRGQMLPDNGFESFHKDFYRRRFPSPKRNADYPADAVCKDHGFHLQKDIHYEHFIEMSEEQFLGFLRTQSNLQLRNSATDQALMDDLSERYDPFFRGNLRRLLFGGLMKVYQAE